MKVLSIAIAIMLCAQSLVSYCQSKPASYYDAMEKTGSEQVPAQLQTDFPYLYKAIMKEKASDKFISRIYFGVYQFGGPYNVNRSKGTIFLNTNYLFHRKPLYDYEITWDFYNAVGYLYALSDNGVSPLFVYDTTLIKKGQMSFALNKATEIANNVGYCELLKEGIRDIKSLSINAENQKIRFAAEVMTNTSLYTLASDLAKEKGCPQAESNTTTSNNVTYKQPITTKKRVAQADIDVAVNSLYAEVDNVTGVTRYYYGKRDYKNLRGEGLLTIIEENNGFYYLGISVYSIIGENIIPYWVKSITLNAGYGPVELETGLFKEFKTTYWNGQYSFTENNFYYKNILKPICTTGFCNMRYYLGNGRVIDYSLSKHEVEKIRKVVSVWEVVNGLQQ